MFKGLRNQIAERRGNRPIYLLVYCSTHVYHIKAKVEKIEKLKNERDADDAGLKDIRNIVSKLNGIASVWSCVSRHHMVVT